MYLIVPALTDTAGQCRIYSKEFDLKVPMYPLKDYRSNQDSWKEVGLMNSRGELVCLNAPLIDTEVIKSSEPLMATQWFVMEIKDV